MQRYDEVPEESTLPSQRVEVVDSEPQSLARRVGQLEGKVDLLTKDVRAVLSQTVTSSKKLATARTLGAVAAGALAALAPQHAGQAGKLIDALLSIFV
jgi:hypothetical protein